MKPSTVEMCIWLLVCLFYMAVGDSLVDDWNVTLARYDALKMPNPQNTTQVRISMYISDLEVNTDDNSFVVKAYFRQKWDEPRLSHRGDSSPFQLTDRSKIWTPDTYFRNQLDGKLLSVTRDNVFLRVTCEGEVHLSQHLSLKLSCNMNLAAFPFDTQVCSGYISSYGHTADKLRYSWVQTNLFMTDLPLYRAKDLVLVSTKEADCTSRVAAAEYSCLRFDLVLRRSWRNYLTPVFMPLTILCVIAWLTFWVRQEQVRIMMLMFTLALAVFVAATVKPSLPENGHTMMIDYFSGISFAFIFVALVQFVNVRRQEKANDKNIIAKNLDASWRLFYPIVFAGFIIVYSLAAVIV